METYWKILELCAEGPFYYLNLRFYWEIYVSKMT